MIKRGCRTDLTNEESCERNIDNDSFVNGLPDHLADEFEQVEVVVSLPKL
jgi:hypothetical protein